MHIKLLGCNGRFTHSTLALFYVRECFSRHLSAATITLCQQTINDSYYEALLNLTDNNPNVVCFSVYIWNHQRIKRFILDLARLSPETTIILGGPEAEQLADLSHPNLCTITGEVEGLDSEFYTDLSNNCLKKQYSSQTVETFQTPYKNEDFATHLSNRHIYYESSRGCPFKCSYCLSAKDTNLRHLASDQVIQELSFILKYNPKIIRFIDRTFNAVTTRTIELWQHLIQLDTPCHFHFEIAPNLFTPEMFDVLKKAPVNRFQFEIGLQSTNPETLSQVHRKTNTATALANIKQLMELDTIHLHVDLILGLPHESYESYRQSFDDVFATGCHYIQMGLLKILPDTPIAEDHPELIGSSQPPYELLTTPYLSPKELKELYWLGECVEKFYNSHFFKPLFIYLRGRQEGGFDFFLQLLHTCIEEDFFSRAATQKLLSEMLAKAGTGRNDLSQYLEILQTCWLYSGMRKLPSHLPEIDLAATKAELYKNSPQNLAPYYDYKSRNLFFRKAEFVFLSEESIRSVLPEVEGGQIVCFLPPPEERETIFKQAEIFVFDFKNG